MFVSQIRLVNLNANCWHCTLYDQLRNDLFGQLSKLVLDSLYSEAICELLLFGNQHFNNIASKLIWGQQYHLSCVLEG